MNLNLVMLNLKFMMRWEERHFDLRLPQAKSSRLAFAMTVGA